MYLSDRDLLWAIETGKLIVEPPPQEFGPSSIDLHLDKIEEAKVWDLAKYEKHGGRSGARRPELLVGNYDYGEFSREYLKPVPEESDDTAELVQRRGRQVIVRHGGFLLWQTKEEVGTPPDKADLICFVDGKSTKARAGIVVHLTAPTIHTSWSGHITLEIVNLGPFDLVLQENDVLAQFTVARVTSCPNRGASGTSKTYRQRTVHGKD